MTERSSGLPLPDGGEPDGGEPDGVADVAPLADARKVAIDALFGLDEALVELSQLTCAVEQARPVFATAQRDMDALAAALGVLLRRPAELFVGQEHRDVAVLLVTSYLERDDSYDLLARMLLEVDDSGVADPTFRLAVVAALAQLCADALVVAVASAVQDTEPEAVFDDGLVDVACRDLLARLALARTHTG